MSDIMLISKTHAYKSFEHEIKYCGWGTMEDYHMAFLQRVVDVEKLHEAGRCTGAMHFGGVAIECYLKYLIFTSLPEEAKWEWKTGENDPGHTITNPGHSYQNALRCYNKLWSLVQRAPLVLKWLNEIENPEGHFIDLRYLGKQPDDAKYKQWRKSYQGLLGWLRANSSKL